MSRRPAGPPPGGGRRSPRPGGRGTPGRDDRNGPGAARASGRSPAEPGRPTGGAPRRPSRDVPSPRGGSSRGGTAKGRTGSGTGTGRAGTGRTGAAPKGGKAATAKNAAKSTGKNATSKSGRSTGRNGTGKGGAPKKGAAPPRSGGRSGGPPRGPARRPARPRVAFHRRDPLKRLNGTLLVVAFVLSLFAGRLVQLQTIDSGKYTAEAREQRIVPINLPAVRGDITDAQGNPLAMTVEARTIFADPSIIKPADRQRVATTLAPMLGLDPALVLRKISTPKSQFEVLAHDVRPDQARLIAGLDLPGINSRTEYQRKYPNDSLAAGVIGFVNAEGEGAAGLESSMNTELAGRGGRQRVEIGVNGQHIPMGEDQIVPPVPGKGLRLTLERDIQFKAQQAIERQVKKTGARSGTVIVMEPRTGRLLALASAPGYDPNHAGAPSSWGSPVVQEAYEPGSTGKVITAAAAMEKGGVRPDTPFRVPYSIKRYDKTFHDSEPHRTEDLTFAGVLAKSSNVGTIKASERISAQQLYDYERAFGFGEKTGIGLPGETPGLLKPPSQWSGTDRYPIAFGQTVSVNAVQMASVYATIANGGVRVAPNLVAGTTDGNGTFTPAAAPAQRRVISAETARQIRDMLEGVTTKEGTAPLAQIKNYRVAGKTGTAEIVNPACGCYRGAGFTASFAGFAPADDPQLVVQVVLQRPTRGSHYGGDVAAPVFRDVMMAALAARKIPPTGSKAPKVRIYARD
ncbi:peptidoglycan D,D-transpeptidase FtsI family protein [Actinomadura atramentaria]|uniref:peptidoglycan D,D-transpeptidase FtsI family protein n=1 Tax=Actinomadura atramentaria TaxID=1990 RepID=UPI0003A58D8C|nr:penicillin-binding protein 2 [Actinomadura atramentaria]